MSKFLFRSTPTAPGAGLSGLGLRFLRQPAPAKPGCRMSNRRPSGFTHGKMYRSMFLIIIRTTSRGIVYDGYVIASGGAGDGWFTWAVSGPKVMSVTFLNESSRSWASRSNASGGAISLAWMPPITSTENPSLGGVPSSCSRTQVMSTPGGSALLFGSVISSQLAGKLVLSVLRAAKMSAGLVGVVGGGTSGPGFWCAAFGFACLRGDAV